MAEPIRVVASVGTDKHPFDRMIQWIDSWTAEHPDVGVFVQYGTSTPPRHADGADLTTHAELLALIEAAQVVVSHGGPSTVMDVRGKGIHPIVVGRDPDLGEHIDEHQMRFAEHLDRHELAQLATSEAHLHQLIDDGLKRPGHNRFPVDHNAVPAGLSAFAEHMNTLLNIPTENPE